MLSSLIVVAALAVGQCPAASAAGRIAAFPVKAASHLAGGVVNVTGRIVSAPFRRRRGLGVRRCRAVPTIVVMTPVYPLSVYAAPSACAGDLRPAGP